MRKWQPKSYNEKYGNHSPPPKQMLEKHNIHHYLTEWMDEQKQKIDGESREPFEIWLLTVSFYVLRYPGHPGKPTADYAVLPLLIQKSRSDQDGTSDVAAI